MKIISFLNIKGGVGKTTSTVNVAAELGNLGYKVLVIDIDPQANASAYLGMSCRNEVSMYELLKGEDHDYIRETVFKGVYVVPSNIKLIMSEAEILADTKRSRETRLKKWINSLNEDFDYILIDCPPSLGMLTINALTATDYILVPIKVDKFALDGFEYLISTIEETKREFNSNLKLLGLFVTMDKATKINREIKNDLAATFKDKFFKQTIRENVEIVKSAFDFIPISYFNKRANAAKDYAALTEGILNVISK